MPSTTQARIAALLPDHWVVEPMWEWKALAERRREPPVLLATLPDGDLSDLEERLGAVAILPHPPPLVLYGRVTSKMLPLVQGIGKALPVVKLATPRADRRRLAQIVNDVRGRSMLHLVAENLPFYKNAPILTSALEKCLLQWPLPEGKALMVLKDGGCPFIRKAGQLAAAMNCSLSFLEDEARRVGIRLDYTVRFITLLHILILYESRISPFGNVAPRVGIKGGSALTGFVRRITGHPPREAIRKPLGEWGRELAQ